MEPINYGIPNPDQFAVKTPDILGSIAQGMQFKDAFKARQDLQAQQEQYKSDLTSLAQNPTPDAIMSMMVKHPEQANKFKPMFDQLNEQQQKSQLSSGAQIYSALHSGNVDLAKKMVSDKITAYNNSGLDSTNLQQISDLLDADPKAAQAYVGVTLASIDPKFSETFSKIGSEQRSQELHPFDVREKVAKAGTAESEQVIKGAEAQIAPQKVSAEYQKTVEDIKTSQLGRELDKQRVQIAAMNAATAKETNGLKRQELGLQLAQKQQDFIDKVNAKQADAQSAYATSDNILNSIDRILAVPKGVRESAHGTISSKIPTLSSDTADYEALLDTLGSQAFLSQVSSMKGMGALSDAEGKKLTAGLQNLGLTQSATQAEKNIKEMKNIILKARKNMELKTGVKAPLPESTHKGNADIASIYSKYGIK